MPTKIRLIDRLPRIAVTIQANGQSITLENVLIDTGSVTTVFKTDPLSQVGIGLLNNDIVHTMYGIGGREFVIAKRLDTLILSDIPKLKPEQRNEAKRFVTLIDALYEHKVKLISTAAVAAEFIYSEGDGSFEFARTVSRLAEMQSAKWIEHG